MQTTTDKENNRHNIHTIYVLNTNFDSRPTIKILVWGNKSKQHFVREAVVKMKRRKTMHLSSLKMFVCVCVNSNNSTSNGILLRV